MTATQVDKGTIYHLIDSVSVSANSLYDNISREVATVEFLVEGTVEILNQYNDGESDLRILITIPAHVRKKWQKKEMKKLMRKM